MEQLLRTVPGATDVVADRIVGKPYVQYEIDREAIARYGVNIRDVQDVIEIAIGGENLTMSVEGRERYPIRVRYLRELRERFDDRNTYWSRPRPVLTSPSPSSRESATCSARRN